MRPSPDGIKVLLKKKITTNNHGQTGRNHKNRNVAKRLAHIFQNTHIQGRLWAAHRNVLLQGEQENRHLIFIDLGDTGVGHPIFDIAGITFMMLEPDYAEGRSVTDRIVGMSRPLQKEFCRRWLAEKYQVTDKEEIENLLRKAALVGRMKTVFVAQRWATYSPHEPVRQFLHDIERETITLVPEIREAIRYFISL